MNDSFRGAVWMASGDTTDDREEEVRARLYKRVLLSATLSHPYARTATLMTAEELNRD
jgi:hypothetical protein